MEKKKTIEIIGEKLAIGYKKQLVVQDVDIKLAKGEITSIIGPNGSGKSTLLKALTKLLPYRGGKIIIDGEQLHNIAPERLAKKIGILPQRHSAPPDFTVRDLVGYGRLPYQKWYEKNNAEDEKIVDWALKVTGTWELKDKSINECSGGESQRVWIAVVLAQQPEILFLDEPTTFLDISHQQETMRLVKNLNREFGMGIVMVLHDLTQALEVSDKIIVLKNGRKYSEGIPQEVITSQMLQEVYNVECRVLQVPGRRKPLLAYGEIS